LLVWERHRVGSGRRQVDCRYLQLPVNIAGQQQCRRRSLYKFIRDAIYEWHSDVDTWTELGLIRIWDLPVVEFEPTQFPNNIWFRDYQAAVICLMCHRLIGHIVLADRMYDSSLILDTTGRIQYRTEGNQYLRGHMIAHFHLDGRPWPNEHTDSVFGWWSVIPGGDVSKRWQDEIDHIAVVSVSNNLGLILPVIKGGSPTEDEVREYYRNLL